MSDTGRIPAGLEQVPVHVDDLWGDEDREDGEQHDERDEGHERLTLKLIDVAASRPQRAADWHHGRRNPSLPGSALAADVAREADSVPRTTV
jgi:hypothetical protein